MQTQLNATVAWRLLCFALMACPTLVWIWLATHDGLGADPVAWLTHQSGSWALYALFASLSMTPLRRWTGWTGFLRIRRQLGLWAFFYASIHLLIYLLLDLGVDWRHFLTDVLERPYITVGLLAWLLLLPLALTSNQRMVRRLGRRWKRLHQAVYLIGALACLHYLWLVKADLRWPLFFLGLYAVLMLARSRKLQPWP